MINVHSVVTVVELQYILIVVKSALQVIDVLNRHQLLHVQTHVLLIQNVDGQNHQIHHLYIHVKKTQPKHAQKIPAAILDQVLVLKDMLVVKKQLLPQHYFLITQAVLQIVNVLQENVLWEEPEMENVSLPMH